MKSSKTRQATQSRGSGMKNHQLEGDGVVTGFYNFLHKRHTKTMKACKDVLIPDTIVFDHNFPRGWFTSDLKSKEITKKQGKELDAASIANSFCKPPSPAVNVVATYMCSYEEEDPQTREAVTITSVEFFNEETLKEFVARKTKREGILQRFIAPKGLRNNVIQAIWSPRLCMVQRRTNRGSIKDKIQCERDPYPVAVTYEGPSHFSEESTCAAHTTDQVKAMCANIAQHFFATEHKYVTRMVLYFKVDERDQLWLLWCGSLRVSDKEQPSEMPLNLAPKFDSPSLEAASPKKEEAELHAADLKHLEMTNDTLFYTTYVKNYEKKDQNSTAGGTHQQQSTVATGKKSGPKDADKDNAADNQADNEEWHKLPGIQDQYRELCIDRETVLSAFDDIFYEAYGHFLRYDPGPFNFEVDRKVAQTLGVDVLQELMQAVKIDHTLPSDDGATTVDDEELCFTIPVQKTGPIKQLGDAVARWVNAHYDRREQELKEEAASAPPAQEEPQAAEKEQAPPAKESSAGADEAKEETREEEPAQEAEPTTQDAAQDDAPQEAGAANNTEEAAQEAEPQEEPAAQDEPAGTNEEPAAAEEQPAKNDEPANADETAPGDQAEAQKSDEDNWMDE
uniref:Uncharacterized protein n=1 Tax=Neobodo designis TaxID=312471 RepID=A0A7S1MM46_NEODS|mmetsp:Transcript_4312/g.13774  ORF Transcript_4312/g.13774 Transcript_4312/m.13774 type:complete len:622 (+) Transcript_4312:41-1906(+)